MEEVDWPIELIKNDLLLSAGTGKTANNELLVYPPSARNHFYDGVAVGKISSCSSSPMASSPGSVVDCAGRKGGGKLLSAMSDPLLRDAFHNSVVSSSDHLGSEGISPSSSAYFSSESLVYGGGHLSDDSLSTRVPRNYLDGVAEESASMNLNDIPTSASASAVYSPNSLLINTNENALTTTTSSNGPPSTLASGALMNGGHSANSSPFLNNATNRLFYSATSASPNSGFGPYSTHHHQQLLISTDDLDRKLLSSASQPPTSSDIGSCNNTDNNDQFDIRALMEYGGGVFDFASRIHMFDDDELQRDDGRLTSLKADRPTTEMMHLNDPTTNIFFRDADRRLGNFCVDGGGNGSGGESKRRTSNGISHPSDFGQSFVSGHLGRGIQLDDNNNGDRSEFSRGYHHQYHQHVDESRKRKPADRQSFGGVSHQECHRKFVANDSFDRMNNGGKAYDLLCNNDEDNENDVLATTSLCDSSTTPLNFEFDEEDNDEDEMDSNAQSCDDDFYHHGISESGGGASSPFGSNSGHYRAKTTSQRPKKNRDSILQEKMIPLLSPAKTRSKMHDLAVKHRLITNQNTRGQGVLHLSAEEKRTLLQEGYRLPTRLPLDREEEEALKIVRRKIKNKLSAQESRRKRKEYIDTLEKKIHAFYGDNLHLRNRLKQLEAANRELALQIKRLQSPSSGAPVTAGQ